MNEQRFTATLSPGGSGRSSWCVLFRHPVRLGPDGKPGLRVRRGLGTSDKVEAQRLVDQANAILGDEALWTVSAKEVAEKRRYDNRIVSAFYDDVVPTARDGWALRDGVIPLPLTVDGYTRVLLMGATGAGKTTLVRQLIGTGGENEKFPSISTAKTTTCDIEIILARDDEFAAVVSFLTKDQVRQLVEECVCAAALSSVNDEEEDVVTRRFLEHSEQRFRLSYLLGLPAPLEDTEPRDVAGHRHQVSYGAPAAVEAVNAEEREHLGKQLQAYLNRVRQVTEACQKELEQSLDLPLESASQSDKDAFEELFEDRLRERREFQELVDDILDDVESRFDGVATGTFEKDPKGWPVIWRYRCAAADRGEFIRTINYFGSNQAPWFGKLLTPLVDGIRVKGPFTPSISDNGFPGLVLMDGEGLGHAANAATSVSTRITKRYETADVILLVDNAMQPMLATPMAALRNLVTSGQQSKLVMAFTHLDQVKGDNLPNEGTRRQHVLASVDNVIRAFRVESGKGTENVLKRISRERTFFFHNLQDPLSVAPAKSQNTDGTKEELRKLIDAIRIVGRPPAPVSIIPVYDDANLVLCIQKAAQEFREPWRARLGLGSGTYIEQEHWTRIKALTRRLGLLGQDEYDNLRPVADFISRLQERIHPFLAQPLRWEPLGGTPKMTEAIDLVARGVFTALYNIANERIVKRYAIEWQRAYGHRGYGSAATRSRDVETIYEGASPIPGLTADATANHFLREVRLAIRDAIKAAGGKLIGIED